MERVHELVGQKGAADSPFLEAYVSCKNLRVLDKSWYSRNLNLHISARCLLVCMMARWTEGSATDSGITLMALGITVGINESRQDSWFRNHKSYKNIVIFRILLIT